ncbi:hypothetical protein NPIL_556931 [Nephila pilipes]|uniref:Transmembrane protein n=1 Tax=Nephila pilipes TaxID=299642 RepID=A0A8X6PC27_NEPPI|nr:hypothetical protein NPIL_556931 [Nephila pilipes]
MNKKASLTERSRKRRCLLRVVNCRSYREIERQGGGGRKRLSERETCAPGGRTVLKSRMKTMAHHFESRTATKYGGFVRQTPPAHEYHRMPPVTSRHCQNRKSLSPSPSPWCYQTLLRRRRGGICFFLYMIFSFLGKIGEIRRRRKLRKSFDSKEGQR